VSKAVTAQNSLPVRLPLKERITRLSADRPRATGAGDESGFRGPERRARPNRYCVAAKTMATSALSASSALNR